MINSGVFEVTNEQAFLDDLKIKLKVNPENISPTPVETFSHYVTALNRAMALREETGKRYAVLDIEVPLAKEGDST